MTMTMNYDYELSVNDVTRCFGVILKVLCIINSSGGLVLMLAAQRRLNSVKSPPAVIVTK